MDDVATFNQAIETQRVRKNAVLGVEMLLSSRLSYFRPEIQGWREPMTPPAYRTGKRQQYAGSIGHAPKDRRFSLPSTRFEGELLGNAHHHKSQAPRVRMEPRGAL